MSDDGDDRPALPRDGTIPPSVRRVMADYRKKRLGEIDARIQVEEDQAMLEHLALEWQRISDLLGKTGPER